MEEEKRTRPLIYAHRGASALAPENTLAAFLLAQRLGADGIELDVMFTADKQLIVIHDDTVDRTTNGHGKVAEMPLAALRELDAGSYFGEAFRGEKLPTLAEVYEALGGKLRINVERHFLSVFMIVAIAPDNPRFTSMRPARALDSWGMKLTCNGVGLINASS